MRMKMEIAEREDKLLTDMLGIIRFTEVVSAKLHRVTGEAKIYQVVKEEFAKSDRYSASILLLVDDGASLQLAETSIAPSKVEVLEKASGLKTKGYKIKLSKSSIYTQVVREGKTVQANVSDIIREFLPRPLAYLISKTMGYDKKSCMLTPLHKHGKVIGVLAMSCTDSCEYLTHSVENLALHISTALELAHEHAQRNRALQALQGYQDHLGELVEERTAELKKVNEKLQEEITERKGADEALQTEKNKLQSLIDAMEYGLTIQDRDYNIIYQNEVLRSIFGDRPGEKCYRVYEGKDKLCDGCPAEKAFRDGKSHTSERKVVLPSGEVTLWENTANPIRDAGGRIVSCLEIARNITERKQAEEALRESREKFQKMFESVTDGISVVDFNGVIIEANQRAVEMHGFTSKDELLGRNALEMVAPRDRERIAANMRKAIKGGVIRGVEYTLLRANGTEFPAELSTSVLRDASGNPVGHITLVRDITERKQMGEALRESEERSRSIVENSQTGIMILDDAYRFTYVNDELCQMSGYSREEIIGQDFRQFLDKESRQLVAERYIHRQRGEEVPPRYEFNFVRKDGQKRRVEISSSVIKDSAGKVKTVAQLLDVTERKLADEALRESQKFSSSLLESSPNPISVVNVDTSVRYVNPAFEKLTGFTSAEIVGRKAPYPWWIGGKRERVLAAFKDAIEHGGRRTERNFQKKKGEHFWVSLSSAPVMQDGKPVYMIISWLDITERKRAEEKGKQLQQELYLAQRLAAVGELAAGVAHEINNPLTGVLGFSQRLMRKSTDKEVSRDLEIIHSEARRAADVVQNLLTFARRRQPKKEYTSINDILQRTLELRSYALHTSNIEVTTALAPRLPKAMVDFPQIQEVFLNIILNAEQAMGEAHGRGELVIKTRRLKDHVRISLTDDGPGISPENLVKVFDPFFTTREQKGGTGLGLSACHGIVTEHGGRIYVRSKPGEGATFIVELPLSPVETTVVSQS
jgi:PAS domain S-box-containing protein